MGISLSGTEAWKVDDRLEPGSYIAKAATVERTSSSSGNPQVKVDWRVLPVPYQGAEQTDWITFTEPAMGRVVQALEAAGVEIPAKEFESYEAMADWFAEVIREKVVEMVIRLEPSRKDPSKEWPTVKGYRRPSASDIPGVGFGNGSPQVKVDDPPPF